MTVATIGLDLVVVVVITAIVAAYTLRKRVPLHEMLPALIRFGAFGLLWTTLCRVLSELISQSEPERFADVQRLAPSVLWAVGLLSLQRRLLRRIQR